jgi:acetylornithine deacetylase/succinyl-diaminopimelate desuccinylase-like protein
LPEAVSSNDIRPAVESGFGSIRKGLERLVRIPSVSAEGHDADMVRCSADETAAWLEHSGLRGVRLLEIPGAHPAVFGQTPGPAGSPTVLLYAHHDVQPPGDEELWDSLPFDPTERDGRLFGRGTADDKAGIAAHAAALQAWAGLRGGPPVNVSVFIEGEEEIASQHLPAFLSEYGDLLEADAIILADCSNWRIGEPALTTSLRGILDFVVEVRTLDHAVHSGVFGGPVPDALLALCRLIASLHDDDGDVIVDGLKAGPYYAIDAPEHEIRQVAGLRPGVSLLGSGSLAHRLWGRPAVAVLGIDAPPITDVAHKLLPVARAYVSIRLAPGDETQLARTAIEEHLRTRAPWGAEVTLSFPKAGEPHLIGTSGSAFEAFRRSCAETWGCAPVESGSGGSLPLVAELADAFPDAELLLTGVSDPDSRPHCENESVHLDDLRNCCLNEAILLGHLAGIL